MSVVVGPCSVSILKLKRHTMCGSVHAPKRILASQRPFSKCSHTTGMVPIYMLSPDNRLRLMCQAEGSCTYKSMAVSSGIAGKEENNVIVCPATACWHWPDGIEPTAQKPIVALGCFTLLQATKVVINKKIVRYKVTLVIISPPKVRNTAKSLI